MLCRTRKNRAFLRKRTKSTACEAGPADHTVPEGIDFDKLLTRKKHFSGTAVVTVCGLI